MNLRCKLEKRFQDIIPPLKKQKMSASRETYNKKDMRSVLRFIEELENPKTMVG